MVQYQRNPVLDNDMLPVEIVLHPSWWNRHEGISFDEDFFFHPARRVEIERKMEQVLHDRWGQYGLGEDRDRDIPQVGAVHLAAGFIISQMLGCEVRYTDDEAPQVIAGNRDALEVDVDRAFGSEAFKRFESLTESMQQEHGYLAGDVNWGGVLNTAIDLRGQELLMDLIDRPEETAAGFRKIQEVIDRFAGGVQKMTGTSSVSVNRNVRHLSGPVFLHSECSHTMISNEDYQKHLMPLDVAWSEKYRPFGIHYCGVDPHRYAEDFGRIPHLDFLDVGWGGDLKKLREHLPQTFLNIRLSPVDIVKQTPDEVASDIRRLVKDSNNPWLTGVCCINMDQNVPDANVAAIFDTVNELREEYRRELEQ
jgi:hypothetical protein